MTTLYDLIQVPEDKVDAMLVDLKTWIGIRRKMVQLENIVGKEIINEPFKWIDDDKHDIHINLVDDRS